ncbi:MAG: DUF2163 domain-containing protein [Sulfitobacter sp.]
MVGINAAFEAHLAGGLTTVCHTWQIIRRDGVIFAFTDHDMPLEFDGINFVADAGLGAKALAQTTGLSVDNTEAMGALSDFSLREDEIEQGRFDGAEVKAWLVNWADVTQRWLQFRGTIGEISRANGAFRAELRGLTEALNRPLGRVYQKPCTAVLGDSQCGVDTGDERFFTIQKVQVEEDGRKFSWQGLNTFEEGWFARGRFEVREGPAKGLWGIVKHDRFVGTTRTVELWEPIRGDVSAGTEVRLVAGCDKRLGTCRVKFNNIRNFQGFPDLPSEDWILAVPRGSGANTGGSLR